MADFIEIRGIEYPVERFTDAHLKIVQEVLTADENGSWVPAGFKQQSEAAEVILEVICPDLPESVIRVNRRGKYVWLLDIAEISYLLLQIVKIYRTRKLAVAQARKAIAEVAEEKKWLAEIEGYLSENRAILAQGDAALESTSQALQAEPADDATTQDLTELVAS